MRIVIAGLLMLLAGCRDEGLKACESAIQSKLKAPSTYRTISFDGNAATQLGSIAIVYDAKNSFGVPLRSKGTCFLQDGRAKWFEDPA